MMTQPTHPPFEPPCGRGFDSGQIARSGVEPLHNLPLRDPVHRQWVALEPQQAHAARLLAGVDGLHDARFEQRQAQQFVDRGLMQALVSGDVAPLDIQPFSASQDDALDQQLRQTPLSLRLIRKVHGVLLARGRGSTLTPGEFRRSQNWIGGTRPGNAAFVPPPAGEVLECMSRLERFLNDLPEPTPLLLKAAHAGARAIRNHPPLPVDGNGLVGRLLITLLLCEQPIATSSNSASCANSRRRNATGCSATQATWKS